jgi:hypothetical protein
MISDYLRIEKALMGALAVSELNAAEVDFCKIYRPAFEIGRLAFRMHQGYYAHKAAIEIAKAPGSDGLIPCPAADEVLRKDGTSHTYDLHYYLDYARTNQDMAGDLERIWIIGGLIAVGDALEKHKYLTRVPLLELVRHLRNGIAHGNAFNIKYPKQLANFPAHNRDARVKTAAFEITPQLHGTQVLFDFIGAADVLDVLMSVEIYLTRIRERHAANELDAVCATLRP